MQRDPDASVVALFRNHATLDVGKSEAAGRPIYNDMEVCELRYPGSRNVGVYPATSFSHWAVDPRTGLQQQVTYAERFSSQYRQFKEHATQTKSGTTLQHANFLTEARKAELRALNIYTIEALAELDGNELKNLGHGGRDMKNAAIEYLAEADRNAPSFALQHELDIMRARNMALEQDVAALKAKAAREADPESFEAMSLEQLREYITINSGVEPKGDIRAMNKRTLIRMAESCKPLNPEAA